MPSIVAIIVTYYPEESGIIQLLRAIESQVSRVVIIDNGSPESVEKVIRQHIPENGLFIFKGYNSGTAGAINTGISEAEKLAASHIVLFDQDGFPEPDMVENLISAMNKKKLDCKVAAVGPEYSDVKGEHASPFVKLKGLKLRRVDCNDDEVVAVDHLISSGCLISMDALKEIGGMEERLFIDYVDTEWCQRAIYQGYSLFGVCSAHMQHDLGDDFVTLFGRTIPVHSSLRYYYLIRNGLWLLRQSWVPSAWRIMDARRLVLIYIVFSLFVGTRLKNWKMMTTGIWHGMTERMGRYER
jgi:rhamnosyltransferase